MSNKGARGGSERAGGSMGEQRGSNKGAQGSTREHGGAIREQIDERGLSARAQSVTCY